jgi:hypothetical protein
LFSDEIGHFVDQIGYVLQLQVEVQNSREFGYVGATASAGSVLGRKDDLGPLRRAQA